jgi:hypothetical protein
MAVFHPTTEREKLLYGIIIMKCVVGLHKLLVTPASDLINSLVLSSRECEPSNTVVFTNHM